MKQLLALDYVLRVLSGIVYRLCLVTTVIIIIYTGSNVYIQYDTYAVIIYVAFYINLYRPSRWVNARPKIRLFADYCLINYVLYGKNIDSILPILLVLLPIINSPNHSGKKRSLIIYVYAITTLLYHGNYNSYYTYITVVLLMLILTSLEFLRSWLTRFLSTMYKTVYDYYGKDVHLNKTYNLYRDIIDSFKSSKISRFFSLDDIYCFKFVGDGSIALVNSSCLAINIEIRDNDLLIDKLKNNKVAYNFDTEIDGATTSNNMYINIDADGDSFVYLLTLNNKPNELISYTIGYQLLKPVFERVSRVLNIEKHLQIERDSVLKKIKGKYYFVENARLVMHFLRNKISPITNYFQLVHMYDECNDTDDKIKLNDLINIEKDKVDKSIALVLGRINYTLEKARNPFVVTELSSHQFGKLIITARNIWASELSNKNIKSSLNSNQYKNRIMYNEEYLEILITDIVTNIKKHNDGKYQLLVHSDAQFYKITFSNSIKPKDLVAVEKLVDDFMSNNTLEIFRRTTSGMYFIKSILLQMNIDHAMYIEGNYIYFELKFKGVNG